MPPKGWRKQDHPEEYARLYGRKEEPVPEVDEPIDETQQAFSVEDALRQIADADLRKDAASALQTIGNALDKLSDADKATILATPAVASLVDRARTEAQKKGTPGTVICDDQGRVLERVDHNYQTLVDESGDVTWTPMQTRWISFNGIRIWVQAGVEMTSPPIFRDIAKEAWNYEVNQVEINKRILRQQFGDDSMVLSGDGRKL